MSTGNRRVRSMMWPFSARAAREPRGEAGPSAGPSGRRFRLIGVPIVVGIAGSLLLLAIYLGVVGLVQGWLEAVKLLAQDAYLAAPLMAGFGIQAGLYTYLRMAIRERARGAGAMTGASGGTSAAAMVACCAHRVADLLPFLGLSAAAGFLAAWKVPFMIVGLAFSLAGIGLITARILAYRAKHMNKEVP